jgi:small-conductance mechanosensitive channel
MAEKSYLNMRNVCVTVAIICIAILAGGGQWLPDVVEKMQIIQLKSLSVKVIPAAVNFVLGALVFSVAYLLYRPAKAAITRSLDRAGAHERGKVMVLRSLQLFYWLITIVVIASLVAPDLLGKLFLGISVFTAAIALALKDLAADFVSGALLQITRRFNAGDSISLVGLDAKGTVLDIGYLQTKINNDEGLQIVPNRLMWGSAVKILKPEASKIIMPPGYVPPKAVVEAEPEPVGRKLFHLFQS